MQRIRVPLLIMATAALSALPAAARSGEASLAKPSLTSPTLTVTRPNGTLPRHGRPAPNLLTSQQAQASLLADRDPFWRRAYNNVEKAERRARGPHHGFQRVSASLALPSTSLASPLSLNPLLAARACMPGTRLLLHAMPVPGRKEIALTFDDGPHPRFTPQLLATLKQCHVPATFFVVGKMAERYPDLIREEVADGFEVANHTYHHVSLVKIPQDEALAEIEACDMVLQAVTGKPAHLFRPPGGRFTALEAEAATRMGYTTVLWTDDPGDYTSPPESVILARTLRCARNGGILLFHDGIPHTTAILPTLIADLRAEGYTFVSVSQLAHRALR